MEGEKKLPWILVPSLIGFGAIIMVQIYFPDKNILGIAVVAVLCGLLVYAAVRQYWVLFAGLGVTAITVGAFVAAAALSALIGGVVQYVLDWVHSFPPLPTIPAAQGPSPVQVWMVQNYIIPIAVFLILITAGNVYTWMASGGEKAVAILATTAATIIGSLLLFKVGTWFIGFGFGVTVWAILFFTGKLPKPARAATPLAMASAGLGVTLVYVFVLPALGWVGFLYGGNPSSAIVAMMGFVGAAELIKFLEG